MRIRGGVGRGGANIGAPKIHRWVVSRVGQMDVLQPFVPLGDSGTVPRGQRLESTLVCLSCKCLFNQDGSGCGALVAFGGG